jgi:hypothetical protein
MERERDSDDDRTPDEDRLVDGERGRGAAEDYKPLIDPEDELSDYEARTHGGNRQI